MVGKTHPYGSRTGGAPSRLCSFPTAVAGHHALVPSHRNQCCDIGDHAIDRNVRNPDIFLRFHTTGRLCLLRAGVMTPEVETGRWPVQDPKRRNALWVGDDIGEERRVFVPARVEFRAICDIFKVQDPETLPRLKVFGDRDGDSGSYGTNAGVGHHVTLEQRKIHDARIFDAAARRASLVRLSRFERDSQPLNTHWCLTVKVNSRVAMRE